MATGYESLRAMFTSSHGLASQSAPGLRAHGTTQAAVGGAVSAAAAIGAYGERMSVESEGGRILMEDEGQEPQQIDVGGAPPGNHYNTSALRTQLNAVPVVGRTIDDVAADVKAIFRQHGVLMVVSSSKKFVSGRLYKKTLSCQRFNIVEKKNDGALTVKQRQRRSRRSGCKCAVSILHPLYAPHPKLSAITLEHEHPVDKAEVEAKMARKAWLAAKFQFLGRFEAAAAHLRPCGVSSWSSLTATAPPPSQPSLSLQPSQLFQLFQPPQLSQPRQPSQLLSPQYQYLAKRKRTSDSAMSMPTMGVDIRIPTGWQVESKSVQGKKCIGTHNGSFHCDEALACAMLKLLPEWSDAVIVRTRDSTELAKCEVVIDVGGIYDPISLRFDHHQKMFKDTLSEESFGTRLSSAGLVYKHFGHRILKLLVDGSGVPGDVIDKKLYGKVYKNFMEHIDAIDNGVDVASGPLKYDVSSHLSARVARLNPRWNELGDPSGPDGPNHRFMMAMSLTGGELCGYVRELAVSWWPAREIVADSLARRNEYHPSGEIAVLSRYCPWKGHLLELEEEMGIAGKLKFVIYADGINPDSKWRIQAVPQADDSVALRLSLAKPWLGLRDDELSAASNIPGCVFVHVNGFIGENATKAGALAMAFKSLEMAESTI